MHLFLWFWLDVPYSDQSSTRWNSQTLVVLFYPLVSWGNSPDFPGVCPHKTRCSPGSRRVGKPAAWVEKLQCKGLPEKLQCKGLPVGKPCLDLLQHLLCGAERHQAAFYISILSLQSRVIPEICLLLCKCVSPHCSHSPLGQHLDLVMSKQTCLKWRDFQRSLEDFGHRFWLGMCSPALQLGHKSRKWGGYVFSSGDTPADGLPVFETMKPECDIHVPFS